MNHSAIGFCTSERKACRVMLMKVLTISVFTVQKIHFPSCLMSELTAFRCDDPKREQSKNILIYFLKVFVAQLFWVAVGNCVTNFFLYAF
jgi:hypothetical protein